MDIINVYHRQKEKIQYTKEKGKEKGYTTHIKLEENIKGLMDRLKKKQEQMEQLAKEVEELEKELKEKQEEKESKQEKRERLYGERSEELERTLLIVKFMESFFILDKEKEDENESDLFDKTNEKEIAKMLDKKYTFSELKNEIYYFFRANVFGIGRTITTAKEKKCILMNHDTGDEFEFSLKNKDGPSSSSSVKNKSTDKSKDELIRMYAFVIRNINKDCKKK